MKAAGYILVAVRYDQSPPDMGAFLPWVEAKREQVFDLTTMNFIHFDDVLKVMGKR